MKHPNTFIIGAPKCGTTALAEYLRTNPQVFMSSPKEPHHFLSDDMPDKSRFPQRGDYLSLFQAATTQPVIAEASVWYLFSQTAVANIHRFSPDARLIAMLRRPDDMVYSMHNQSVITFNEDIVDFSEAWDTALKEPVRARYASGCRAPQTLQYDRIAAYAEQLERVYRFFPEEQVLLIFYDDFRADTPRTYQQVLDFLQINADERQTFQRINENQQVRNRVLGRLLKNPPPIALRMLTRAKRLLGVDKVGLKSKLRKVNMKTATRPALDEALRQDIIKNYRSDIEKLAGMTGRDLSNWLH